MKNNILMVLFLSLIFTSCSIDWKDAQRQEISELKKQITELKNNSNTGMILFEKKNRCAGLSSEIEARIITMNKEYANIGKFSIGEIFYSPTKDVCLWVRLTDTHTQDGSPSERRALYEFGKDFGSSKPIIGCEKILADKQGVDTCEKWESQLRGYKGENEGIVLNP